MLGSAVALAALSTAGWLGHRQDGNGCAMFSREVDLGETQPLEATVYFTAAGWGDVSVNGAKADETAVLEPGWTQWDMRLLTVTYNVTHLLQKGKNSFGFMLGNGWFGHLRNQPVAKFALVVRFLGDSEPRLALGGTDNDEQVWLTSRCPITYNDIYNGESYDARVEPAWEAAELAEAPEVLENTHFSLQKMPPIRMLEFLEPSYVTTSGNGAVILDYKQNIAGWIRLALQSCSNGTTITVRHAEVLTENRQALDTGDLRHAKATDVYTCSGAGAVEHEPRFTYHGFRFAEIAVAGEAVWSWTEQRARVVHTDVQPRGEVKLQSEVLTAVQKALKWTLLDNMHSVPTDCPQRDERMGWMGDAALCVEVASLNFDMKDFYINFLQNIADAQRSTFAHDCRMNECVGALTDTVPHPAGIFGTRPADPSWGLALPMIVDVLMRFHGPEELQPFAENVQDWADFLLRHLDKGTVAFHNYGDWLEPGRVPSSALISEMTSGYSGLFAIKVASKMGEDGAKKARFAQEYSLMLEAYEQKYWNETLGCFGDCSQAPQIYALTLLPASEGGTLSPEREQASLAKLLASLQQKGMDTGIVSTKLLFPVLTRFGKTALGLQLASSTAFPSWGFMLSQGSTTITEHWDSVHNPSGNGMSSRNHPMFGSIGAWFFTDLVGLRVDRSPMELGTMLEEYHPMLPSASGSLPTLEGLAEVEWSMSLDGLVSVKGTCPAEGCMVRVPLNKRRIEEALKQLFSQGVSVAAACGASVCVMASKGPFLYKLGPAFKEPAAAASQSEEESPLELIVV